MGQILHRCATTTEAVRQASIAALAKHHWINPMTVQKWKKHDFQHDAPMGPKNPRSTVLTEEEEAAIVAFRRYTLLPLDDCLYTLQESIPHLTRSSLHRCFQRRDISRLPETAGNKPQRKKFKTYPIGYFHIDIAEVGTDKGKLYLFVAIDRTTKFTFTELHERATRKNAVEFLRRLIEAVPYIIHTVLTDNGIQFTNQKRPRNAFDHAFDRVCDHHGIEHRLTKLNHPWTNGQVERMNRTLKEATVKTYHYSSHTQLKQHLHAFLLVYNFAKRLKTLKGITSYEYICSIWTTEPERFKVDPHHHTLGLYT